MWFVTFFAATTAVSIDAVATAVPIDAMTSAVFFDHLEIRAVVNGAHRHTNILGSIYAAFHTGELEIPAVALCLDSAGPASCAAPGGCE